MRINHLLIVAAATAGLALGACTQKQEEAAPADTADTTVVTPPDVNVTTPTVEVPAPATETTTTTETTVNPDGSATTTEETTKK